MNRRDVLRSLALVPVAAASAIVPGMIQDDIQVPQSTKSFIERAKYLDYTELDFLQCRLILRDHAGNKYLTKLFTKVVLSKDPLSCVMGLDYINPHLKVVSIQFMDKDRRCLFKPRPVYFPEIIDRDDILKLTYTIKLD